MDLQTRLRSWAQCFADSASVSTEVPAEAIRMMLADMEEAAALIDKLRGEE